MTVEVNNPEYCDNVSVLYGWSVGYPTNRYYITFQYDSEKEAQEDIIDFFMSTGDWEE
jgi:hypothetical protein